MRSFRSFATRWPVSALCVALMLGPMVLTAFTPSMASAEINTTEVAVVDFRNDSAMPEDVYGSMATDAVVVELLRSGKFTVTEAEALKAKMEDLGLKAKEDRISKVVLSEPMMQRLGQEVGANSVITGFVRELTFDAKRNVARVRLDVRVLDVASQQYVNGAVVTAESRQRIGAKNVKAADLIVEAINEAARDAVSEIVAYTIPEATVIGTWGDNEILLNQGTQNGLQPGMKMVAVRRDATGSDEVVGTVQVTSTSDSDSHARILNAPRGVRAEDRVRAVYDLPKPGQGVDPATSREKQKKFASASKLLLGVALLVGAAALFGGGGSKAETVGNAVAMAGAYPDITPHSYDSGVFVGWNKPSAIADDNIIEYHVWRDSLASLASNPGDVAGIGAVASIAGTNLNPISTPVGNYDGHSSLDGSIWAPLSFQLPTSTHDGVNTVSPESTQEAVLGRTSSYWVSCLYTRTDSSDATVKYYETSPRPAGKATYINRPLQVSPGGISSTTTADLTDITFQFEGSLGANQYTIEVSTDPDFARDKTWVSRFTQSTSADGQSISRTYTDELSVCEELGALSAGTVLYWRVGARNSADSPGPYPASPNATKSGTKNTRYVYSDPSLNFMFLASEDVPGPPSEN